MELAPECGWFPVWVCVADPVGDPVLASAEVAAPMSKFPLAADWMVHPVAGAESLSAHAPFGIPTGVPLAARMKMTVMWTGLLVAVPEVTTEVAELEAAWVCVPVAAFVVAALFGGVVVSHVPEIMECADVVIWWVCVVAPPVALASSAELMYG